MNKLTRDKKKPMKNRCVIRLSIYRRLSPKSLSIFSTYIDAKTAESLSISHCPMRSDANTSARAYWHWWRF